MKLREAFKPSSPRMTVTFVKKFLDGTKNYETIVTSSKEDLEREIEDAFQGKLKLGDLEVYLKGKTTFSLTDEDKESLLRTSKRL